MSFIYRLKMPEAGDGGEFGGEPTYTGTGSQVLMFQPDLDDTGIYASATACGATDGTFPRMVPIGSPYWNSSPVNEAHTSIVDVSGTGAPETQALRVHYDAYQDAPNWAAARTSVSPGEDWNFPTAKMVCYSFSFRANAIPKIKFLEFIRSGANRFQFCTMYASAAEQPARADYLLGYYQISGTNYWMGMEEGYGVAIQPVGPYVNNDCADSAWHAVTACYACHTSNGANDGLARMWVDHSKIIDTSAAKVDVTPTGGENVWCHQSWVDDLYTAQAINGMRLGGAATAAPYAANVDYCGITMWYEDQP